MTWKCIFVYSVYLYIYWIARSYTRLAQSVERQPFKLVAVGSSPTSGGGRDNPLVQNQKSQGNGDIKPIMKVVNIFKNTINNNYGLGANCYEQIRRTDCYYILRGIWEQQFGISQYNAGRGIIYYKRKWRGHHSQSFN